MSRWLVVAFLSATLLAASVIAALRRDWYTGWNLRVGRASPPPERSWIVVLVASRGSFSFGVSHYVADHWLEFENRKAKYYPDTPFGHFTTIWNQQFHTIILPWWFIALPAVISCGYAIRRHRRRHPVAGFCAACGYDVRATPKRCPECGTALPIGAGGSEGKP